MQHSKASQETRQPHHMQTRKVLRTVGSDLDGTVPGLGIG